MADEDQDKSQKTEEPTERRLQKAIEEGQAPQSKDLTHLVMLIGMGLMLLFYIPMFFQKLKIYLLPFIANPHAIQWKAIEDVLMPLFGYILAPLGFFFVLALGIGLYQNKLQFSTKSLEPDLSKLSPLKGFGRIFSSKNLFEFFKSLIYVIIIFSLVAYVAYHFIRKSETFIWFDTVKLLEMGGDRIIEMLFYILIVVCIFAVIDVLFQKFEFRKQLRMTKQEVKDEHKETEGDPLIKGRIRKIQTERARARMISAVPTADVVITNPTHYAVALKYDENTMNAPIIVAKGQDLVALKIREIALEHRIYVTRNPPLARALYKLDIDEEVPAEHYKAVAEIIIYVMKMKEGRAV